MDEAVCSGADAWEIGDLLTQGGVTLDLVHGDEALVRRNSRPDEGAVAPTVRRRPRKRTVREWFQRVVSGTSKHHGSDRPTVQLDRSAHNRVVGSSAVAPATIEMWLACLVHRAGAPVQRFRVRPRCRRWDLSGLFLGTYVLDQAPWCRGAGLQLRAHGPHRVRQAGGLGGLAGGLAPARAHDPDTGRGSGVAAPVGVARRSSHLAMATARSRVLGRSGSGGRGCSAPSASLPLTELAVAEASPYAGARCHHAGSFGLGRRETRIGRYAVSVSRS